MRLCLHLVAELAQDDNGQDLIEYALLASFISLVAVAAITNVGSGVNAMWEGVDAAVPSP
jgi:Flp pilus assembly pilin Flp